MASDGDQSSDAGSFWAPRAAGDGDGQGSSAGAAPDAGAIGSGAGGGSFWSTFDDLFAAEKANSLDSLLKQEDCTVEALLDEEDIIQEFKACNERLVAHLSEELAAITLMQFVTQEASEEATHARKFRYPFITVELLSCGREKFSEVLVKSEPIMDALWSFMEATQPLDVNPVLAGYFSRAVASLLAKHPAELAEYLRRRGAAALLDRFLERLHLRSLAELFACLACAEQQEHLIFPTDGLVERLLARFEQSSPGCEVHEHITQIIDTLLEKKESICFADDLLKQLTSPITVGFLVDGVFSGTSGVVNATCSILSTIVNHCYVKDQSTASLRSSTPLMSPVTAPLSDLGDDGVVNVGDEVNELAAVRSSGSPSQSSVGKPATPSQTWLEARGVELMGEISSQFPKICGLLDAVLEKRATMAMPIGAIPAAGSTAVAVVNLLVMLARTGSPAVLDSVSKQKLLLRCFDMFFRHPWNGLLHNGVLELSSKVLGGVPDALRPALLVDLLCEGKLLERLVSEYEAEEKHGPPGSGKHCRVGYMAHLHAMCRELRDYGAKFPECDKVLGEISGWSDVVVPALDANHRMVSEALGGGIHDGDRGLASSSSVPSEASTMDQKSSSSDFVLDDPDDFDGAGGALRSEHAGNDDSDDEEEREDRERLRRLGVAQNDGFDPGFDPGSASGSQEPPVLPVMDPGGASAWSSPPQFDVDWNSTAMPQAGGFDANFGADFESSTPPATLPPAVAVPAGGSAFAAASEPKVLPPAMEAPAGGSVSAAASEPKDSAAAGSFWNAFGDEPAAPPAPAEAQPSKVMESSVAPEDGAPSGSFWNAFGGQPAAGKAREGPALSRAPEQSAPAHAQPAAEAAAPPKPAVGAAGTPPTWTAKPAVVASGADDSSRQAPVTAPAAKKAAGAASSAPKTSASAAFAAAASSQPKFGLGTKPAAASTAPPGGSFSAAPTGFGAIAWGAPPTTATQNTGFGAFGSGLGAPLKAQAPAPGGSFASFSPAAAAFGAPAPAPVGSASGFGSASVAPTQNTGWADFGSPAASTAGPAGGFGARAAAAPSASASPAFAAFGAPSASPWPGSAGAMGTENLFSLLGDGPGRPAQAPAMAAAPAASTPWPPAPSPWDAPPAPGRALSAGAPPPVKADAQWPPAWGDGGTQPAPFGALAGQSTPAPKPEPGKSAHTWVAEFDPLA